MEEIELYEKYWNEDTRPGRLLDTVNHMREALIHLRSRAMLLQKLAAFSKREAKRVRRCKRNLQNLRRGGFISYEPLLKPAISAEV